MLPDQETQRRIRKLIGTTPLHYASVSGGYTPAARWVCALGSTRYFVKMGTTPLTAGFLRSEFHVYGLLQGRFMPQLVAWEDHDSNPLLILEDLSPHYWPPPWTDQHVVSVLDSLHEMHATQADLPLYGDVHDTRESGWRRVAADPALFLSVGLASAVWLERALPTLIEYEERCPTAGNAVTHQDIRSDNLCITGKGAVLIDWNLACLSNPRLDIGFWLPSLAFEGGPSPEQVLPDAPDVAAWVAGFFAARAGQPPIADAPRVRLVQRQQLQTALPWAARSLGLPPPTTGKR